MLRRTAPNLARLKVSTPAIRPRRRVKKPLVAERTVIEETVVRPRAAFIE